MKEFYSVYTYAMYVCIVWQSLIDGEWKQSVFSET